MVGGTQDILKRVSVSFILFMTSHHPQQNDTAHSCAALGILACPFEDAQYEISETVFITVFPQAYGVLSYVTGDKC